MCGHNRRSSISYTDGSRLLSPGNWIRLLLGLVLSMLNQVEGQCATSTVFPQIVGLDEKAQTQMSNMIINAVDQTYWDSNDFLIAVGHL